MSTSTESVAPPALVCDTGRVAALYQPRQSETLIISFAPRQDRQSIWGSSFLQRFGTALLGLVDYRASWFPAADMATVLEAVRPLLAPYRRIILYGFSMGGYGALKYSARLGAEAVLAFSPQYSIHPAEVGAFDPRRARKFFNPHLHEGMRIAPGDIGGQALIFHDPLFYDDRRHAELIRAVAPEAVPVLAPFTNHDTIRFAVEIGMVEPLLRELATGGPIDVEMLRPFMRARRLQSQDYVLRLAGHLRQRHPGAAGEEAALRLMQKAQAAGNAMAGLCIELAHRWLDRGDLAQARAAMDPFRPAALRRPADRLSLQELRRRLALHEGKILPEAQALPQDDPQWAEAVAFLRERCLPEERILAPAVFAEALGRPVEAPGPGAPAAAWVVVRKASLPALTAGWMRDLAQRATPVFANGKFVIWTPEPSFGLVDLREAPEVAALMRDVEGAWGRGDTTA